MVTIVTTAKSKWTDLSTLLHDIAKKRRRKKWKTKTHRNKTESKYKLNNNEMGMNKNINNVMYFAELPFFFFLFRMENWSLGITRVILATAKMHCWHGLIFSFFFLFYIHVGFYLHIENPGTQKIENKEIQ